MKIRNKSQRSVHKRAALTLSTERLTEREGEEEEEREGEKREREHISQRKEGGRERGRYGGERLSETSVGGVSSNFSSAMALALLHAHDARS